MRNARTTQMSPPTPSRNIADSERIRRVASLSAPVMRGMMTYALTSEETMANTRSGTRNAA